MEIDNHCRNIKQPMTMPSLFQQTPPTGLVETVIGVGKTPVQTIIVGL